MADYSQLLAESPELEKRFRRNLRSFDRDGGEWALTEALQSMQTHPPEPVIAPKQPATAKVLEADKIRWNAAISLRGRLAGKSQRTPEDDTRLLDAEKDIKMMNEKYTPVLAQAKSLEPVIRDTPDAPPVYRHTLGLFGGTTEINPDYAAWKIGQLKDTIKTAAKDGKIDLSPTGQPIAPTITPKKKPLIFISGSPLSNATREEADARWLADNPTSGVKAPRIRRWNPETGKLE